VSRLGIDTGGTFTDFVALGPEGLIVHKRRTSPDDPSRAILAGVEALSPSGRPTDVVHGSTVATNAVLERRGARVALVATAGFEDVLRIGRQTRPALYDIFVAPREPIVDPRLTLGIEGRLDPAGREVEPITAASLKALVADPRLADAEIVAVCLLHSYANPAHERRVARALEAGGWAVCSSHEVLPEYREFERWSTTVVNAYVTPLMDRYLARLEKGLGRSRLSIMQSNGGSISAKAARAQAVRTVLSGPAAGVVGAREVARQAGFRRVITFDMGGTSTDVSLVDDEVGMTTDSTIGDFPIRLPVIDIHTVGAGGGSIAFVDTGGALRVGPRSAGAVPGPACYGEGTDLTVTDANLLVGRLDPEFFLGGQMPLDEPRAREAAATLAASLSLGIPDVAEGVIRVANANMERAIRVVSVERGHDPREFALVAFGGAGGMHACEIAAELEITTVIVPRHAGVLSALGMLLADVTRDYSASVLARGDDLTPRGLARRFTPLVATAERELGAEGYGRSRRAITRQLDVRYAGQSYEITLPFSPAYRDEFDRLHHQRYGYSNADRPIEVVNVRVQAAGHSAKPRLPYAKPRRRARPVAHARRAARFGGRAMSAAVYRWADLLPGSTAPGPAIVTGAEATAVVPPGWRFTVDGHGNVVASKATTRTKTRTRRS
jgi:N-methylhydantoinase A/oxoprolinase/acetone carboxylase beta subunit